MKQKLYILPLFAVTIIGGIANATEAKSDSGIYAGVNYNYFSINYKPDSDGYFSDSFNGINPYIGYNFNKYFAVEGGAFLTGSEEKTSFGGLVNTSTDLSGVNADLVGKLPVLESVNLLASVGYTYTELAVNATVHGAIPSAISESGSASGYRVGLGAEADIYKGIYARAMGYYADPGFKGIDGATIGSVGLGYRF